MLSSASARNRSPSRTIVTAETRGATSGGLPGPSGDRIAGEPEPGDGSSGGFVERDWRLEAEQAARLGRREPVAARLQDRRLERRSPRHVLRRLLSKRADGKAADRFAQGARNAVEDDARGRIVPEREEALAGRRSGRAGCEVGDRVPGAPERPADRLVQHSPGDRVV